MLKFLKNNLVVVLAGIWSVAVALFWLALRVKWSGISRILGADTEQSFLVMHLPLLICILLWIIALLNIAAFIFLRGRKWCTVLSLSLSGAFTVLSVLVVIFCAASYMRFILPGFFKSLGIALLIGLLALILFFPSTSNSKKTLIIKGSAVGIAAVAAVFIGYGITIGSYFTYDPVVYAVENEYQIVFSTNSSAIAWVEIGDERYYDLYGGSMKSNEKVHKISVPQEKLDEAKAYSVHAQKMIYRGPFGGYMGDEIEKAFDFRPVDSSDGLVYYTMTDVHHAYTGAVNTAKSVENLDFLVMLGDNVSIADTESDAQFANMLAYAVTGGEIPVIYARGNHEIKGKYAEELHKYVGSKNGNFYYWFTMSDVFGITLDIGEDHDDDWWEYYGTAQFVQYQNEQTEMLRELIASEVYSEYNYTLVACHIPIPFVNSRKNHTEVKQTWTELLNEIEPDLVLSGHQHSLYPFIEGQETKYDAKNRLIYNSSFNPGKKYGGYLTDFEFNSFIAGRRGSSQTDSVGTFNQTEHIGLVTEADILSGTQVCRYINSDGETVSVYNPFADGDAQTEFVLPLK